MAVTILTTVIPAINRENDDWYCFKLYFTPRISCSGKESLQNFQYVYNWVDCQEYLENNIRFRIGGNTLNDAAKIQVVPPPDIKITSDWLNDAGQDVSDKITLKNWRRTIWRSMFDRHTQVDGWEPDNKPYELVTKLSIEDLNKGMNTIILKYKNELRSKSLKELGIPGVYDSPAAERRQKNTLVAILNHLFNLTPDRKLSSPYINSTADTIAFPSFLLALRQELNNFFKNRQMEIDDLTLKISLNDVQERNVRETTEFHKKMTAFANFPFLLRQTGWFWDIKVQKSEFVQIDPNDFEVSCTFYRDANSTPEAVAFFDNISFMAAGTHVKKAGANVDYNFKVGFPYLKVLNGMITTDTNFAIEINLIEKNEVFERIDSLLKQKYNFEYYKSQALNGQQNQAQIADISATRLPEQRDELLVLNEERAGFANNNQVAPVSSDYNSSGFSVRLKNLTTAMQGVLGNPPNLTEGTAEIYGHHIHKGYRPDLKGTEGWKSLCERRVLYTILLKDEEVEDTELDKIITYRNRPSVIDLDEGWVVESAQGSNSGKLYVDEDLFRFNDWSISSDKLFYTSEEREGTDEIFINENSRLTISSMPQRRSLPPLRYGYPYTLRMRFVDICGGGPAARDSEESSLIPPFVYERSQGINPPLLYLGQCLHKHGRRENGYLDNAIGQDLLTMVVRSAFQENGKSLKSDTSSNAIRFIAPPKLDFHLSKKHGVFDSLMTATATNNRDAAEKSRRFIELSSLPAKPAPDELVSDKEEVIERTEPIDFLFDPLVAGFELLMNNLHDPQLPPWMLRTSGSILDTSDFRTMYYDNVNYMRLSLAPDGAAFAGISDYSVTEENPHSKKILLQQGVEKELGLSCSMLQFLNKNAVTGLLHKQEVEKGSIRVKLIHATQKPCMLHIEINTGQNFQEYYKAEMTPRSRQRGEMMLNIECFMPLFPCLTSESYLLHVCYIDIISNREKSTPRNINDTGYKLVQISKIIKTGIQPDKAGIEQQVFFSNLSHSFNDTRCRWVYYRLEAVSKFKKYFPATVTDFSIYSQTGDIRIVPAEITPADSNIRQKTTENWAKHKNWAAIKSSNQPPVLSVGSLVPLIRWEGAPEKKLLRICDTVRIYLEGDWYLTGEDEQIAVFYINHADANSRGLPRALEGAFSQFGMDPAAIDGEARTIDIPVINSDFFYFPPAMSPNPILENFIQVRNLDFDNNSSGGEFADYLVSAAIYQVEYMPPAPDELLGRFYIDIRIAPLPQLKKLYMPFLRFAIARYQPNAEQSTEVIDLRFSHILLTDFVQLLPYRELIIQPGTLRYNTPSVRKSTLSNINIISAPGGNAPAIEKDKGLEINTPKTGTGDKNLIDPDLLSKDKCFASDIDVPFTPVTGTIIEEYELFELESDINIKSDTPSRNNISKRVIFSYTLS